VSGSAESPPQFIFNAGFVSPPVLADSGGRMKCFVTGASGFIGSNLVHELSEEMRLSLSPVAADVSQAQNLLATETYELRPLAESRPRPAFGEPGEVAAAVFQRCLRLPDGF
jgi:hypothetical protein